MTSKHEVSICIEGNYCIAFPSYVEQKNLTRSTFPEPNVSLEDLGRLNRRKKKLDKVTNYSIPWHRGYKGLTLHILSDLRGVATVLSGGL